MRRFLLDRRTTFGSVVIVAALFRLSVWRDYANSPLDMYTKIPTLDMKLIFEQAYAFLHYGGAFTMHRLLCAFSSIFTGGVLTTHGIVLVQMLLGILAGVFTCLAAIRISGSRFAGFFAGVFAGCYAPALMYECFVMKESVTLLFSAIALWAFVSSAKSVLSKLAQGVLLAALPLARPSGILWGLVSTGLLSLRGFKRGALKAALPLAGFLLFLIAVMLFNYSRGAGLHLFDTNAGYNLQVGAISEAKSYNVADNKLESLPPHSLALKVIANVPVKILALVNAKQAPDNINYYFMKEAIPTLVAAPSPLLLIPLGVAGLLFGAWMALRRRALRYAVPLAHFVCMSIPICVFIVTGRYALFLLPSLAVGAGCFLHEFIVACRCAAKDGKMLVPSAMAALYMLLLFQGIPRDAGLRADDFIAYGMASNMKYGLCQQEGDCYAKALEVNPDRAGAATNLGKWLIDCRHPEEAVLLLSKFREGHQESFGVMANYVVALCLTGRQAEAEKALLDFGEPQDMAQRTKWTMLLDISRGRGQNNKRESK